MGTVLERREQQVKPLPRPLSNKPKPKHKPKDPKGIYGSKDTQLANKEVSSIFNQANNLATKYGLDKPSEKLDLTSFEDLINPNSPTYAGKRSDDTSFVLNRLKEQMAGLSSGENQALREQATNEINRQAMANKERTMQSVVKNRLRGAVADRAMSINDENQSNQLANFEQKNLIDNVKLKNDATNNYGSTLLGVENNEYGRVADARNSLFDGKKFNIDMSQKDVAQKTANLSGLGNIIASQQAGNKQYELTKQGMRRSGGRDRNPNRTTTTNTTKKTIDQSLGIQ